MAGAHAPRSIHAGRNYVSPAQQHPTTLFSADNQDLMPILLVRARLIDPSSLHYLAYKIYGSIV
jgi:hypothetical protein